jgi:hypothetical protein
LGSELVLVPHIERFVHARDINETERPVDEAFISAVPTLNRPEEPVLPIGQRYRLEIYAVVASFDLDGSAEEKGAIESMMTWNVT